MRDNDDDDEDEEDIGQGTTKGKTAMTTQQSKRRQGRGTRMWDKDVDYIIL